MAGTLKFSARHLSFYIRSESSMCNPNTLLRQASLIHIEAKLHKPIDIVLKGTNKCGTSDTPGIATKVKTFNAV